MLVRRVKLVIILLCSISVVNGQSMVDVDTPEGTKPSNTNIGYGWELDFSDEFNGTEVDLTKWTINNSSKSRNARPKIGVKDWYWKPHNVWVQDGLLNLQVEKHDHNTMYCGSIFSQKKYETTYGYFEARMKVADASKGTHTAFWLQGVNMGNVDGTANDGAEIDVFESAWLDDYTKSVIHIDGYGKNHKANTKQYNTPGIHEGYHTWGFHWTPTFMKIYYDGTLKVSYTGDDWIVHGLEYLWLSDGASFGIEGDYFTSQPNGVLTAAYVDYIRVWKQTGEQPVIQNGDFEATSGTTWAESNSDIVIHENKYPDETNSYYCRFPGIPNGRNISQTVSVEPGETYSFKFNGRIQNSHSASDANNHSSKGPATLKGEILNGTDVLLSLSTQSNTYATVQGEVTIPAGVSNIKVKISKNWNVGYVDNVELIKKSSTNISDNKSNLEFNVYPNPTSELINVECEEIIHSYQLVNSAGVLVAREQNIDNNRTTIELNNYTRGLYLLKLESKLGNLAVKKIMVK